MVISDEAVEAAAKLLWYSDSDLIDTERPDWADAVTNRIWAGIVEDTRNTARAILEAAAPHIAAAAYEADAKAFRSCKSRNPFEWYVSRVMASLFESRAARIRSRA